MLTIKQTIYSLIAGLTLFLSGLKLMSFINWSWGFVLAPVWASALVFVVVVLYLSIMALPDAMGK